MRRQLVRLVGGLGALGIVATTVPAHAQVTPFQIVGHIESFALDPTVGTACPASNVGARMTVNGINIVIPCYAVILMPAAYLTPKELFDMSPVAGKSGLSLNDKTAVNERPYAAFEVAIDGNIVNGVYRAGLVSISQQSLNMSAGFIQAIDYNTGELCVGATAVPVVGPVYSCAAPDTRVRINDPEGRYGLADDEPGDPPRKTSPDTRFSVDTENPTIHALTGFPMCVPRVAPPASDPLCPIANRTNAPPVQPDGRKTFVMTGPAITEGLPPGQPPIQPCSPDCDPKQQAPFIIGDYITFQGTLAKDVPGSPGANPTHPLYISAHTVVANIGIYTSPGSNPAYVTLDESLIGTMGRLAECVGFTSFAECQDRIKIEGFTTDPSRPVRLYALDYVPNALIPTVRRLARDIREQAVYGRFRFVTGKNARAMFDANGDLKGATRELMIRIDGSLDTTGNPEVSPLLDGTVKPKLKKFANELEAGQYTAPVGEYIFPEPTGVQGGPMPALNFECLAFLVDGWSHNGSNTTKQLDPWPGAAVPARVACSE